MPSVLAERPCVPCAEGARPMTAGQASEAIARVPGWIFDPGLMVIKRTFRFSDFVDALTLTCAVGALAERENHHPDVKLGWGYCEIAFSTHSIGGLHENDFVMAAKVNALADGPDHMY